MSPRKNDIINYLDLFINIPKSLENEFRGFLNDFVEHHLHVECSPKMRELTLHINSNDLVAFTGYIDPDECNEMDLARFKKDAQAALEQQLVKTLSSHFQAHYKWCLTALKSKDFGRSIAKE